MRKLARPYAFFILVGGHAFIVLQFGLFAYGINVGIAPQPLQDSLGTAFVTLHLVVPTLLGGIFGLKIYRGRYKRR